MIKNILTLFVLIVSYQKGFSQYNSLDSITVFKQRLSNSFYYKGQPIKEREINPFVKSNPDSYKKLKSARLLLAPVYILNIGAGSLIGFEIGKAIVGAGEDIKWTVLGAGLLATSVAIPLEALSNKRKREAIFVFNSGLKKVIDKY